MVTAVGLMDSVMYTGPVSAVMVPSLDRARQLEAQVG